jgi:hypothetical protein
MRAIRKTAIDLKDQISPLGKEERIVFFMKRMDYFTLLHILHYQYI